MNLVTMFAGFNKPVVDKELKMLLSEIKTGLYRASVENIRHLIKERRVEDAQKIKKQLSAATISATYKNGRRDANLVHYNGIIILDIDDLKKSQVANLRRLIEVDAHTLACFLSPGGRGLKVFVTVVMPDGSLPVELPGIKKFHKAAYQLVTDYYTALTDATIDVSGKDPGRLCYVSFDPDLYYNERAEIFCCGGSPNIEKASVKKDSGGKKKSFKGESLVEKKFRKCINIASMSKEYQQGNRNTYIFLLGGCCNRKGLPMEDALRMCIDTYPDLNEKEIATTIASAYTHTEQHGVDSARDGVYYMEEQFLCMHYDFRYNIVSARVEFREKESGEPFICVTDWWENSIWRELNATGIKCRLADMRSIINSNLFERFDPFQAYFNNLPVWDGKDYIALLADTVGTDAPDHWNICLRKWLTAMVASLLGEQTVNHVALVFAGPQGTGKTRWGGSILPPELSAYYALAFFDGQERDLIMKTSYNAIVNFDELETLSIPALAKFKKLITQPSIKERKAFGHYEDNYSRRASFIASCNNPKILNDPTGSRRFLMFNVTKIDYQFTIDYSQLYAQVMHLLNNDYQFWFNMDEIAQVNKYNEGFQIASPEEEFLLTYFRKPKVGEIGTLYLTTSEIARRISSKTGFQVTHSAVTTLGKILKKHEFVSRRLNKGTFYDIFEIDLQDVENNNKRPDNEDLITDSKLPF